MIKETLLAFSLAAIGQLPWKGKEHSGIAYDSEGWFHTVPDSGNKAEIYSGQATYRMEVPNRDWEALDIFKCLNVPSDDCFYIADTGMNVTGKRTPIVYEVSMKDPTRWYMHKIPYIDYNADTEAFAINHGKMFSMKKDGKRKLYVNERGKFRLCGTIDSSGVYVTDMDMIDDLLIITYHRGRDYFIKEYRLHGCKVLESKELNWTTTKQLEAIAYKNRNVITAVTEDGTSYQFIRSKKNEGYQKVH